MGQSEVQSPIIWGMPVEFVKATREEAAVQLLGSKTIWALLAMASIVGGLSLAYAQQDQRGATSYLPVDIKILCIDHGANESGET